MDPSRTLDRTIRTMATFDPVFLASYNCAVNCVPTIDGGLADVEEDPEMSCHDDFLVDFFDPHNHRTGLSTPIPEGSIRLTAEDVEKLKGWIDSHTHVSGSPSSITATSNTINLQPVPTGWVCPRCQLCLAPSVASCARCAPAYVPAPYVPEPYPYQPYAEPYTVPYIEPYTAPAPGWESGWTVGTGTFRIGLGDRR